MANENARALRKNLTIAERALWNKINRRQIVGAKFRRQQPIDPYIVDFVCLEKRLIIEVDGGQHGVRVAYDQQRTAWLEAQGFRVIRFWNSDVLGNIEGVVHAILCSIEDNAEK